MIPGNACRVRCADADGDYVAWKHCPSNRIYLCDLNENDRRCQGHKRTITEIRNFVLIPGTDFLVTDHYPRDSERRSRYPKGSLKLVSKSTGNLLAYIPYPRHSELSEFTSVDYSP